MRKMDLKQLEMNANKFSSWLKEHHYGQENSITFKEMGGIWGDHRVIRHMVHYLRISGVPICSGNSGYYYAKNKDEVEGVMKYLMSFISNYQEAFDGLNTSLKTRF